MQSNKSSSSKAIQADAREARLKAALKANMGRRKAQARARSVDAKDSEAEKQDKG
ncbi:MAG: hypothetical protein JXQ85_10075 [Cognatishimia sp.]|uniref:hypothetical protein n=1 Tax=Cognatishimia sp. TaxID=2211648 RepID=UPI003B8C22AF